MIDLSPLYIEAAQLQWLLIPLWVTIFLILVHAVIVIFGLPVSMLAVSLLHTITIICGFVAGLCCIILVYCQPDMGNVTTSVEQATGVTQLQCEHRSLDNLTRQPTACAFRYENTFWQGALTVDNDHQATLYRTAQGTPIPVTRR